MEKNIKKIVWRTVSALVAVLAIVFGYWFFYSPDGYSTKDNHKEKPTSTEVMHDKMYPKQGNTADKEINDRREKKNRRWMNFGL